MLSTMLSLLRGLDLDPASKYTWAGIVLLLLVVIYTTKRRKSHYDAIPAIGSTGLFSYFSAWHYVNHARVMLQEGYNMHKSAVFRVPAMNCWHVVLSDEKLIEELGRAPDDILSFDEAIRESLALDYTLGQNITEDLYHVPIVRTQLTRNLGNLFPIMYDEVVRAFNELLPVTDEWHRVRVLETIMQVVARSSNRVFVGAPTCRDPEYTALTIRVAMDVALGSQIINLFPNFLKPILGPWLTNVSSMVRTGLKHLEPIIEERKRKISEFGTDYPNKPNDLLSWLMDEAKEEEFSTRNLTLRILTVNFAAIHTSSSSFTHALYHLAACPQYIQPLREEIEAVVSEEGWSRIALSRMHKLDSFFKESQRMSALAGLTMTRKALQPYTFSDGTHVPKGAKVSALATVRHCYGNLYMDGDKFDGFRFISEDDEGRKMGSQLATTGTEYVSFGHGRHACPGRFFAANELKSMMAHLLLTYDFKLEPEGVRPEDRWFGDSCLPNQEAEILFRKRKN